VPIPIPETVDEQAQAAVDKAAAARSLPRYLLLAGLAGAYVGVAIVLLISVSAPLAASSNAATKLVQGAVFGLALTLVVFAGAELFTGNAMTMLQGLCSKRVRVVDVAAVWTASLVGNLFGSIAFAAAVNASGVLQNDAATGLIQKMVSGKAALDGGQLFWRALLCNLLVCLALWMAARTRSDGAKLAVLWWALLAFIAAGFEHSVANMTTFALGVFQGSATWADLGYNLAWTVPGNLVGGGVIVGLAYAWLGRPANPSPAAIDALAAPGAEGGLPVDPLGAGAAAGGVAVVTSAAPAPAMQAS
jgi:nitrite transporter NirC